MRYLIDTNVLAELRKPQCNPAVREVIEAAADDELFLSVVTLGEVTKGVAMLPRSKKRTELEKWLEQTERQFLDRVLPIDAPVARLWGQLTASATTKGRTISASDGLIAATARQHRLTLLTRNVADFEATGVDVLNPWR